MRKNRSFNQSSFARSKGSKGKEVSIQLEKAKPITTNRYDLQAMSRNTTERLNASSNWQHNPSISHNILKEIINYSNISQSSNRALKANTIAVFDKSGPDSVLTQLAKIKKSSQFQGNPRKEAKRLTLDFVETKDIRNIEMVEMSKSVALNSNTMTEKRGESDFLSGCKSFELGQLTPEERMKLQIQRTQISSSLQQLTILEQSIENEHSDMIPSWEKMMVCEQMIGKLESSIQSLEKILSSNKTRLEELNLTLFKINKDFVTSRRQWDAKGCGARGQILEEAQDAHNDFLRKLTVKDFQDTVLFNMKVAIPDYKGKTTVTGIYEELFKSRSSKKFTMILKKHTAQMDLYNGRLLSDFTKRINDLETLFFRAETETKHPDYNYLDPISHMVNEIQQIRGAISKEERELKEMKEKMQSYRDENRGCEQNIHNLIDEMNHQVRGQYERQTQKQADFKSLLLTKVITLYRQFRSIREKKSKLMEEAQRIKERLCLPFFENP